MEELTRKGCGFKDDVVYEGDYEDFQDFLANIHEDLDGITYESDARDIPFGSGRLFEVYNENCEECEDFVERQITVWYDWDTSQDGETTYYFAVED